MIIYKIIRKKDGLGDFYWYEIYECSSKREMDEKEKYYIRYFDTKHPNGFNLTDGGEGNPGWVPTEEWRKKISEATIGRPVSWKGKKRGPYKKTNSIKM